MQVPKHEFIHIRTYAGRIYAIKQEQVIRVKKVMGAAVPHALKVMGAAVPHALKVMGAAAPHALKVMGAAAPHTLKVMGAAVPHARITCKALKCKCTAEHLFHITFIVNWMIVLKTIPDSFPYKLILLLLNVNSLV